MRALALISDGVLIANAVQSLPATPTAWGTVPQDWTNDSQGVYGANVGSVVPELDLEVWAAGTVSLTAAKLRAAFQHALASFADITLTPALGVKASLDLSTKTAHCNAVVEAKVAGEAGDNITIAFVADGAGVGALNESAFPTLVFHYASGVTTDANFEAAVTASQNLDVKTPGTGANVLADPADTFTATALAGGDDPELGATAHGLSTGDGPFQLTDSGGVLPAGLALATDYYVIKDDANAFTVATSLRNALNGVFAPFTDVGTGTIHLTWRSNSQRLWWHSIGSLLGPAGDGAISLGASLGYTTRVQHRTRALAYALDATVGGAVNVSAAMYPVRDAS